MLVSAGFQKIAIAPMFAQQLRATCTEDLLRVISCENISCTYKDVPVTHAQSFTMIYDGVQTSGTCI
jgi:hypothetical protein